MKYNVVIEAGDSGHHFKMGSYDVFADEISVVIDTGYVSEDAIIDARVDGIKFCHEGKEITDFTLENIVCEDIEAHPSFRRLVADSIVTNLSKQSRDAKVFVRKNDYEDLTVFVDQKEQTGLPIKDGVIKIKRNLILEVPMGAGTREAVSA
jgi:hypothetical protein